MKNKIRISTAIPASISEFKESKGENSHLTSATLKVFHKGKTADNRIISEGLANKIKDTIGGTPVVARYDEEADDFLGHYYSQSVFGFVPENPDVWEEKDIYGNLWLVTEIRLFTEREDVGKIAKKIIGQAQSLELNPETLEYNVSFEEESERPLIELTGGDLVGLSVLGNTEAPAFTGSGFFEASDNKDLIKELISKYNSIPTEILVDTGGETMEDKFKKSTEEEEEKVTVTAPIEDEVETPEEPETPETPEETDPETEVEGNGDGGDEPDVTEEPGDVDPIDDPAPDDVDDGDFNETLEENANEEGEFEGEAPVVEESTKGDAGRDESEFEEESAEEIGMEPEAEESEADTAALNKAEREELNNYRREHKISIINEYSEYLSEEQRELFIGQIDNYEIEALEKEVAFESMKSVKNNEEIKETQGTSFSFQPNMELSGKDELSKIIKKYN